MKQTQNEQPPRFCFISDTHGHHSFVHIPPCDYLIHCGDFTSRSSVKDLISFSKWLHSLDAKHKIIVFGNNEIEFLNHIDETVQRIKNECPECVVLIDQSVTIDNFLFYGAKYPFMYDDSLQFDQDKQLILISHEPPFNIMDNMVMTKKTLHWRIYHGGRKGIIKFVDQYHPTLACFGHCHNDYGVEVIDGTTYINCSYLSETTIPVKLPIFMAFQNGCFIQTNRKFIPK